MEPENNVNIIGEIAGTDPTLRSEVIMIGGHFDSWHSATGATDNGVSCIVLMEALRVLKRSGIAPKRTIRICLWGGEEQAFIGSVAYANDHFGALKEKPNSDSKKVSVYLNLDNGAALSDLRYAGANIEHLLRAFHEFRKIAALTRSPPSSDPA